MDVIKRIIGGANRTVKLRAAAKREIFRTQRAGCDAPRAIRHAHSSGAQFRRRAAQDL